MRVECEVEGPYDTEVFEALRKLRTEIARETSVPPYVVFHDSMLRELARALPRNEQEFLVLKGAGPSRWQKYGARVLAVTAAAAQRPTPTEGRPAPAPPPLVSERDDGRATYGSRSRAPQQLEQRSPPWQDDGPPPHGDPPSWVAEGGAEAESVWALYKQGLDLESIARETNETVGAVAAQLAEVCRAGRPVDAPRIMGEARVRAIRDAASDGQADLVQVRKRLLPVPVSLGEIRLALVSRPAHG